GAGPDGRVPHDATGADERGAEGGRVHALVERHQDADGEARLGIVVDARADDARPGLFRTRVAFIARDVDPGVSEADDVRAAVARDVDDEARVLVDTPASGDVAEVVDDPLRRLEGAVAVVARDVDPGVTEADDVRAAVARHVDDEARVLVDTPASGDVAEVVD